MHGGSKLNETTGAVERQFRRLHGKRKVSGGVVKDIQCIVCIDPRFYAMKAPLDIKQQMGRIIGELNRHPEMVWDRVIMMGPGRWGSSNIMLGVNTTYSDINNASVLVSTILQGFNLRTTL